jgi:hypothetical protein
MATTTMATTTMATTAAAAAATTTTTTTTTRTTTTRRNHDDASRGVAAASARLLQKSGLGTGTRTRPHRELERGPLCRDRSCRCPYYRDRRRHRHHLVLLFR